MAVETLCLLLYGTFNVALLTGAQTVSVLARRRARDLAGFERRFLQAVERGNYGAADLYAGAWLNAARQHRRALRWAAWK